MKRGIVDGMRGMIFDLLVVAAVIWKETYMSPPVD